MKPQPRDLCRRQVLLGLCASACVRPKGDSAPVVPVHTGDSASSCEVTPGEGWVEVPLADHPELREEGGWISLTDSEHLLEVIVARAPEGCWFTVWRICTHGACEVVYEPENRELFCDCHGSRFAESGEVLEGPAERALTSFPTGLSGDSVWIYRPL